jgi:hypothetical protein
MRKSNKKIRKDSKQECIQFFKDREKRAKRNLKECSINLLFFSFILCISTLDFYVNIFGENICNIFFYISLPISLMFLYLTIKWYRARTLQKRMQTISSITFDSLEKELEKYD